MWSVVRFVHRSLCRHQFVTMWAGRRAVCELCLPCGLKVVYRKPPSRSIIRESQHLALVSHKRGELCKDTVLSLPTTMRVSGSGSQ